MIIIISQYNIININMHNNNNLKLQLTNKIKINVILKPYTKNKLKGQYYHLEHFSIHFRIVLSISNNWVE